MAELDDVGAERAHVFGHSLGGLVGLDMLAHAPHRLMSAVIGGMHPFDPGEWADQAADSLPGGMEPYLAAVMGAPADRIPEPLRSRLLANDAEALRAFAVALRDRETSRSLFSLAGLPTFIRALRQPLGARRQRQTRRKAGAQRYGPPPANAGTAADLPKRDELSRPKFSCRCRPHGLARARTRGRSNLVLGAAGGGHRCEAPSLMTLTRTAGTSSRKSESTHSCTREGLMTRWRLA
jgi:pimeloyl-ACP methyl ester carboxylesterase